VTDTPLNEAELAALRAYDTPTICNALEIVCPDRRALGFTTETLICSFPDLAPMVGYARTATIRSMEQPAKDGDAMAADRVTYYRYVEEGHRPSIMVIQDVDSRPGAASWWGEVHSAVHQALGCLGVVTNGAVRDLDMIADGGLLASLWPAPEVAVNSLHAQGIDRLAPRLTVEATAPDGQIEAVRVSDAPSFALGVQWHPEWKVTEDPFSMAIFGAFGEATRARAASRAG
jgi:hypothetical protein